MASQHRREVLVGLAAILALTIVLVTSYSGRGMVDMDDNSYRVAATFNRIDGIEMGDDVQLAGVTIGEVESAVLDENYRAELVLRVDEAVALPLDTSAAIHTDGLFGGKFIVLEPGGELDTLQDGDEIAYTQDSQIIGELLDLIISEGRAVRGLPASGAAGEDR